MDPKAPTKTGMDVPRMPARPRGRIAVAGAPRPPVPDRSPLEAALDDGIDFEEYARSRLDDFAQR
jgi:hypothetical protein